MPANDTRSIGRPRTPPVTALFVKISALNISAIASVATARLVPRVRIAGQRDDDPDERGARRPRRASASSNGQPLADMSRAAIHAPTPASANWHSESWPA